MRLSSYLIAPVFLAALWAPAMALAESAECDDAIAQSDDELINEYCEIPAQDGDAKAQFHMGRLYLYSDVVVRSKRLAIEWFEKAAEQGYEEAAPYALKYRQKYIDAHEEKIAEGNLEAHYKLAILYMISNTIFPNEEEEEKALLLLTAAAEQKHLASEQLLLKRRALAARAAILGQKEERVMKQITAIISRGHEATLQAMIYLDEGVNEDQKEAIIKWLEQYKHKYTDYTLGALLESTRHENTKKQFVHYKRAASAGIKPAIFRAGLMYHRGEGVSKNNDQAVEVMKELAKQGNNTARKWIGKIYDSDERWQEALHWYKEAAEHADVEAQLTLADRYTQGMGTEQNIPEAYFWMLIIAQRIDNNQMPGRLREYKQFLNPVEAKAAEDRAKKWKPKEKTVGS